MIKKSLLLTLLLALFVPWAANAYNHQVQVGDGTSGQNIAPINLYYNYSYSQQIYTADQINAECVYVGDIESISFYYAGSVAKTVPITVFMKTTEKTSFATTSDWETVTEDDIVFNGDLEIPSTAGWVTITLNAPFAYDGESNLLIAIDKGYYDNYTNQSWRYTAVTNNQVIQYRSDSTDPNPYSPTTASGTSKNLPNIMFNMTIAHPAPSALTVDEVVINTATISWTAPQTTNTITGYAYEYTDSNDVFTGTTTGTTANLTGLTAATDYLFEVKAIYSDGESCWSEALDFTTMEACMTPENLTISDVTAHAATLTWTEGYGDGQWVLQYKLSTEEEYTNSLEVALAELPYTLTGLTAESTYNVQIAPVCDATKTITGNFTTAVACFAPTNLAVEANAQTATFTWNSDVNDYEIAHATDATANPSDNIVGTATENTYSMSNLTLDTEHYFWVRSNCGSEGYSAWAGPVSVHIGYCVPNPSSHDGKGITGVSFGTGDYVVTNGDGSASLPASAPYYGDYSSMIGAVQAGVESTIAITTGTNSYPYTFVIWVDFDNSLSFEDSEVVYIGKASSGNGTLNATITIPATQELGDYRMRIYGAYSYFTNFYNSGNTNWEAAHDPCSSGSYRHAHDYTLRVLEAPSCLAPTNLAVNYEGGTEAIVTWEGEATSYNIDVNGTVIEGVSSPYYLSGLELATEYAVKVQANCGDNGTSDWTNPVSFTTDLCMPEDMCAINIALTDSYSDGWNGGKLEVVDAETSEILGTYTLTSGGSGNYTLDVCDGRTINIVYTAGSFSTENGWVVTDINNEVICQHEGCNSGCTPTEGVQATYTVSCTVSSCKKPTDLAVSEISGRSAVLSWTENGEATEWEVEITNSDNDSTIMWTAVTNPYTMLYLDPETNYSVRVLPHCEVDKWSDPITFTTNVPCPAPTVTVSNVTTHTANVSCNGYAENYEMEYAIAGISGSVTYDFEDGTLQGWTNLIVNAEGGQWLHSNDNGGGYDYTGLAHSGTGFATCYSYVDGGSGAFDTDAYLVSPNSYQIGGNASLNFWYDFANDSYPEYTEVCIATATNPTADDFTAIWNSGSAKGSNGLREANANRQSNTRYQYWREVTLDLSDYAGQSIWIAFHDENYDAYEIWIDDVTVNLDGELTWTPVGTVTSPYTLSDLDPETAYMVRARANCGEDGESEWSSIATFTTLYGQIFTKTINGYGTGTGNWYLIATPIDSITPNLVTNMVVDPEEDFDLFVWDGTTTEMDNDGNLLVWRNFKMGEFTQLEPGKGYLYANKNTVTLKFVGTPYDGDGNFDLTYDAAKEEACLNLVGNPYAVNASIDGNRSFYTMNSEGDKFIASTSSTIEAMEGIFVVATSEGDQVTFTPETGDKSANLALNLSQGLDIIDRAIVRFDEGGQLPKFQLNPNDTKVYIPQEGKDYAVVRGSEMGEMPVSFKAESNGSYTLSFTSEEVSFNYLHLIDNMTGADVDLLVNPSYTFDASTTDYASRFKLVFATGSNSDDSFAFFSNGGFVISNEGEAMLQVVDVTGRILKSETINGSANVHVDAAPGVYMLRLINGDNVKVQKVVVR